MLFIISVFSLETITGVCTLESGRVDLVFLRLRRPPEDRHRVLLEADVAIHSEVCLRSCVGVRVARVLERMITMIVLSGKSDGDDDGCDDVDDDGCDDDDDARVICKTNLDS